MFTVRINFESEELQPLVLHKIKNGYSLLDVCLKNGIPLHHNCGGICSCSTCHIYINSGEQHLEEMSRKEKAFLKRARHPKDNSRLACQCLLMNKNGEIEFTIPDQQGL